MPRVSIIIPVLNRIQLLERALQSLQKQTFQDYEITVVDDHSTDDIFSVTKKYGVEYLKTIGKGVSAARNTGILSTASELVALLDSDDEWLPNKLELQVKYLAENQNCTIVHSNELWLRNGQPVNQSLKHQKMGGRIFSQCTEMCLIAPSSVLVRRSLLNKVGLFDESFPVCEDFDLWLRITATEDIGFISEPLVIKHGGHADQLSMQFHSMDLWRVRALAKHLKNASLSENEKLSLFTSLKKRCEILLKGFTKHQNFENVNEVESYLALLNGDLDLKKD
ncbi:MAG: glycosyltransferase family 2 protein [Bdellovibrio sp.]|nr:glycosyltransferase family 2 protein [Bdellovibrio sp.]